MAGLVTMTDILEGLVGELEELAEDEVVQREDGSWLVSASVKMADVHDLLGLPGATAGRPERTLGGSSLRRWAAHPATADYFEWEGYRIEVVDMDGPGIDKVLDRRAGPNRRGERDTQGGRHASGHRAVFRLRRSGSGGR
jgi:putative hemolysin